MRIYSNAAEYHFFDKMRSIKSEKDKWHGFYFRVDVTLDAHGSGCKNLKAKVMHLSHEDIEGGAYFLHGGDVMLLMKGDLSELFTKSHASMADLFPDQAACEQGAAFNEQSGCSYYGLAQNYQKTVHLADARLALLKLYEKAKGSSEKSESLTAIAAHNHEQVPLLCMGRA